LCKHNPCAAKAIKSLVSNAISTGIMLMLSEGQELWQK
jgi:hypothetical protein